MLAYFGGILKRLVVGVNDELCGPKVTTLSLDGPNDATGLKVEGSPRTSRVQGGAANKQDGPDGVVWLFLLEGGAEAVAAGVTVQAEGAGVVSDGVVVGKNQDRGRGESRGRWLPWPEGNANWPLA